MTVPHCSSVVLCGLRLTIGLLLMVGPVPVQDAETSTAVGDPAHVTAGSPTPETVVTIDAADYLVDVERKPIGINGDWFMDDDANRPPGSATLESALRTLGVTSLRIGGDDVIWDPSGQKLARVGQEDYPSNFDAVTQQPPNATRFVRAAITQQEQVRLIKAVGGTPFVIVNHNSYNVSSPCPDSVGASKQQLIDAAAREVAYFKSQNAGVRFWEIGNECWQPNLSCNGLRGNAEVYASDLPEWAGPMKRADPSILIGANGNTVDWLSTVLRKDANWVDFISYHLYPYYLKLSDYLQSTDMSVYVSDADKAIDASGLSASDRARIKIDVTEENAENFDRHAEWPDRADTSHALENFELLLQILANHPRVDRVLCWNTRWIGNDHDTQPYGVSDALTKTNGLTPIGSVLAFVISNLQNKIVKASYVNDVLVRPYATYDQYTGQLNVFLVNRDETPHRVQVNLQGYDLESNKAASTLFAGISYTDYNPTLTTGSVTVSSSGMSVIAPPFAISEYTFLGRNNKGLNVAVDGSFEDLKRSGWNFHGEYSLFQPDCFDGSNACQLTNGGTATQTVKVVPGTTYTLSAQAKVIAGTGATLALIGAHGLATVIPLTGAAYHQASQTVTIPTDTTSAQLVITAPISGSVSVDDITLSRREDH